MSALMTWFSGVAAADRTALAARLRRRDPELLELLIQQYEYRLYRYLMCLCGNPSLADDLFQETWMRVFDRGAQYRADASFEAWLFTIARHLVIDFQRRKRCETLDDAAEEFTATSAPSAFDELARRERESEVQDAMGRLPAVQREVLLLRFQEDLPLDEIAAVVGSPLPTVKARLYRALATLRGELGGAHA
jgi:RNA polymerase sigma-70 factor, ECF subfamily